MRRTARHGAIGLAALALLGSCASPESAREAPARRSPAPQTQDEQVSEAPASEPVEPALDVDTTQITPISPSFDEGLEVAWWIVSDAEGDVAQVLSRFTDRAPPVADGVARRWSDAGFRLLAVGESEVHELLESLPPVGRGDRGWLGVKHRWTECFRPPADPAMEPQRITGLPRPIHPATLRLIARSWAAPTGQGPVLRVDLALQHHRPRRVLRPMTLDEPRLPRAEEEGEIFPEVTAELALRDTEVVVIVGEAPGERWGGQGEQQEEPTGGAVPAERFDPAVASPEPPEGEGFGPPVERPRSLGEAMLIAETSTAFPGRSRTLVLLIPRVPDRFTLLPEPR